MRCRLQPRAIANGSPRLSKSQSRAETSRSCRNTLERREFLRQAVLAGTAAWTAASLSPAPLALAARGPNEKLNLACIGVANKGADNINNLVSENIVALCDVDSLHLGNHGGAISAGQDLRRFPPDVRPGEEPGRGRRLHARPYARHARDVPALKRGLDVYCEKPLAHSVYEVRQMRNAAAKQKAVTQMGTQIHAGENYRRVVEIVKAGQIGPVSRVHVWMGGGIRPGVRVKEGTPPVDGRLRPVDGPGADAAVSPRRTSTSTGATGGILAAARWPTSAATTWTCRFGRSTCGIRRRSRPRARRRRKATTTCPTTCRSTTTFRRAATSRRCI